MVADVGVDAPLDFFDSGVVCDSSCVAVFAGGVVGTADLEYVGGSHGIILSGFGVGFKDISCRDEISLVICDIGFWVLKLVLLLGIHSFLIVLLWCVLLRSLY